MRRAPSLVVLALGAAACVLPDYEGRAVDGAGGAAHASSADASASSAGTSASVGASGGGSPATTAASGSGGTTGGGGPGGGGGGGASSTGAGTPCTERATDLCLGPDADDFSNAQFQDRWDLVQPVVVVDAGQMTLTPEVTGASVKSKERLILEGGPCGVWVRIEETTSGGSCGLAIGPGNAADDWFRVERFGDALRAMVGPDEVVAETAFDAVEMQLIRVRVDDGGAYMETSADGSCWQPLSGPHPIPTGDAYVRLYHEGAGHTVLDDFGL